MERKYIDQKPQHKTKLNCRNSKGKSKVAIIDGNKGDLNIKYHDHGILINVLMH